MATSQVNEIASKTGETDEIDENEAPEGFARDPAAYVPTDHFLTRFSDRCGRKSETRIAPPITGKVVRGCIEDGTLREGANGCYRLETPIDGHEWRLVVDIRPDADNRVMTALVPGIHSPSDHSPELRLGGDRHE